MVGDLIDFVCISLAPFPLPAHDRLVGWALPSLGEQTDRARCGTFRHGLPVGNAIIIQGKWRDDLAPVAIGCLPGFGVSLGAGGVKPRCYRPVPRYLALDSLLLLVSVGKIGAQMVATMRAVVEGNIALAAEVAHLNPQLHGAPLHASCPDAIVAGSLRPIKGIGLADTQPGEAIVFRACGAPLKRRAGPCLYGSLPMLVDRDVARKQAGNDIVTDSDIGKLLSPIKARTCMLRDQGISVH